MNPLALLISKITFDCLRSQYIRLLSQSIHAMATHVARMLYAEIIILKLFVHVYQIISADRQIVVQSA